MWAAPLKALELAIEFGGGARAAQSPAKQMRSPARARSPGIRPLPAAPRPAARLHGTSLVSGDRPGSAMSPTRSATAKHTARRMPPRAAAARVSTCIRASGIPVPLTGMAASAQAGFCAANRDYRMNRCADARSSVESQGGAGVGVGVCSRHGLAQPQHAEGGCTKRVLRRAASSLLMIAHARCASWCVCVDAAAAPARARAFCFRVH